MNAEAWALEGRLLRLGAPGIREDERDIVARVRRGDPSAFDRIVRQHQKRVYNLAYRMLRRHEDAEDVTQEAFVRAFESLPRFRGEAALGTWICRIAANLCVSWLRSKHRRTEIDADPAALADRSAAEDGLGDDLVRTARWAVARLPPNYRLAVVAYYLEGRSYEEAARVAGIGVRALKTRLYRARKMLREMVRDTVFCSEEVGP